MRGNTRSPIRGDGGAPSFFITAKNDHGQPGSSIVCPSLIGSSLIPGRGVAAGKLLGPYYVDVCSDQSTGSMIIQTASTLTNCPWTDNIDNSIAAQR